jgi:hypothetical protein
MAANIFAQGMDAFDQSWDRTQGFFDKATARKAGRALAGGDRASAVSTYGNAGDVDAVRVLQGDQRTTGSARRRPMAAKRSRTSFGRPKGCWRPRRC